MQGFGGLLRLVPITVAALLSVTTAALSGFGVFFRVSFGLGHDALLRIVIISRPDIKETRSHLVSISSLQTSGDAPVAMRAHKPFIMHNFHGVPSGRQGQFSLKFTFGKASPKQHVGRILYVGEMIRSGGNGVIQLRLCSNEKKEIRETSWFSPTLSQRCS